MSEVKFTEEFKRDAVAQVEDRGYPVREVPAHAKSPEVRLSSRPVSKSFNPERSLTSRVNFKLNCAAALAERTPVMSLCGGLCSA